MLLLPDEFNERTDFSLNVFEIIISIFSPGSCPNLFSSVACNFEKLIVCPIFDKDTWQMDFYIIAHLRF